MTSGRRMRVKWETRSTSETGRYCIATLASMERRISIHGERRRFGGSAMIEMIAEKSLDIG